MKRKEDLYQLIQKLSPVEFRYIKSDLSSRRNLITDNNILLDAFRNQVKYDEAVIKKKFKEKPFVRQFEAKKYYLYQAILKSLNTYNYKHFKESSLVSELDILMQKGLYDQAYRMLKTAQQKCEQESRFLLAVRLIEIEERLCHAISDIDRFELSERAQFVTERFENYFHLKNLYFKVRGIIQKYTYFRTESHEKEMLNLIKDRVLAEGLSEKSLLASAYKNQIKFTYYGCLSDWSRASTVLEEQEGVLSQMAPGTPDKSSMLLSNLNRMMLCDIALNKEKDALKKDAKIAALASEKIESKDYFLHGYTSMFYQLVLYVKLKNLKKINITLNRAVKLLNDQNFTKKIGDRNLYLLTFEVGKAFYQLGQLTEASTWNYKVLYQTKNSNENQDLHVFASFINLIICYEKQTFDLWTSDCLNLKRHMLKYGIMYEFEKKLINFFSSNLILAKGSDLKTFQHEIAPLLKGRYSKSIINYFDFQDWFDRISKVKK